MNRTQQERFDALLEEALEGLPPGVAQVIEEMPVIVEDRPSDQLMAELRRQGVIGPDDRPGRSGDEPMGLHSGIAITERSVEGPVPLPSTVHIFREPIVEFAGGWDAPDADDAIYEEIRITLLHEIGHHFGLDEDDLEGLGYA